MENKIAVIPSEIKEQIEQTKIDHTEAEKIAMKYAPYMIQVSDQAQLLKDLKAGHPGDAEKAKRIRLDIGKICSAVADVKKDDKSMLLVKGRYIDGLYNTVDGAGRLTQLEAKEIELHEEKIKEAKREKLRNERSEILEKYEVIGGVGDLADMSDDVWTNFIAGTKANYEAKIEAERKAEEERIAKEKADEEERKRIRIENDRLKKEAEVREKQAKIEADKRAKEEKARLAKEEKERTEREAKAKKEREAYEAKLKKAADEKARIEKEEREKREKLEAEIKAKEEKERKAKADEEARIQSELNKGDSEKVKDLLNDFELLKTKYSFKSAKNQKMYSDVSLLIDKVISHINK